MRFYGLVVVALFALMMSGCSVSAIQGHGESLGKFDADMHGGKCDFTEIDKKIESNDDVILWGIQGGSMALNCQDYNKSIVLFDKAEAVYKTEADLDNALNNIGEGAKTVLINNNVNEYEGNIYERVMVNTYKGIGFLSLKDRENARVEFNRALDRQRRAKEYFEKEIALQNEKNKEDANKKAAQNEETLDVINEAYADDFDFSAYPDFINPFTTYMSGLFFLIDGDYAKSADLFKESLRMDPDNTAYKADFELANTLADAVQKESDKRYAWIIYENGQGAVTDEIRIDIPLFLVSKNVFYTGIALPKVKEREHSYAHLSVDNGTGEAYTTVEVANMDRVIKTEFKKRFPTIVSQAVLSTITKTIMQKQLNDKGGLIGGIAGALYQGLTNKADVRSWTSLPKSFQAVRVELNGSPISITGDDGMEIFNDNILGESNALVYVKSPYPGNHVVHTMAF